MENNLKDQYYKNMSIMLQMETLTFEAESVAYCVLSAFGFVHLIIASHILQDGAVVKI